MSEKIRFDQIITFTKNSFQLKSQKVSSKGVTNIDGNMLKSILKLGLEWNEKELRIKQVQTLCWNLTNSTGGGA